MWYCFLGWTQSILLKSFCWHFILSLHAAVLVKMDAVMVWTFYHKSVSKRDNCRKRKEKNELSLFVCCCFLVQASLGPSLGWSTWSLQRKANHRPGIGCSLALSWIPQGWKLNVSLAIPCTICTKHRTNHWPEFGYLHLSWSQWHHAGNSSLFLVSRDWACSWFWLSSVDTRKLL